MTFKECLNLIKADYDRLNTKHLGFWYNLFLSISFKQTFWFRVMSYLSNSERSILLFPVKIVVHLYYRHISLLHGISLDKSTQVGGGLNIHHYSCIIITPEAKIGRNLSIYQGVTIGRVHSGTRIGVPTIGNNVTLFAGCKVIGNVKIGNNVIVGSNSVVTHDIPDNAIVAGVPAKILRIDK